MLSDSVPQGWFDRRYDGGGLLEVSCRPGAWFFQIALYGSSLTSRGMGSVAFAAPNARTNTLDVLVSTGRGEIARVYQLGQPPDLSFAFAPELTGLIPVLVDSVQVGSGVTAPSLQ